MDFALDRPGQDAALASAFSRTLRAPASAALMDLPLLLRVCMDELSEVAACTELRAELLREQLADTGVKRPAEHPKVADLYFAAAQMRGVLTSILERVGTRQPPSEVRRLFPDTPEGLG